MRSRYFRTLLLLLLLSVGSAFSQEPTLPQEPASGKYSVVGGLLGSLAGVVVGGYTGALVAAPSVNRCKALGIPLGGHMRGGLVNRKFALNMAAITLLTGTLALVDYGRYEAYDEKSLRFTIPLNLLAPPIVSYLIGR